METVRVLEINKYEYGIILNALNELRNQEKQKEVSTDAIDEVMIKVMDSPSKRTFKLGRVEKGTKYIGEAR